MKSSSDKLQLDRLGTHKLFLIVVLSVAAVANVLAITVLNLAEKDEPLSSRLFVPAAVLLEYAIGYATLLIDSLIAFRAGFLVTAATIPTLASATFAAVFASITMFGWQDRLRTAWILAFGLALPMAAYPQVQNRTDQSQKGRPNFSGTWVMNRDKTDWQIAMPTSLRYVVRQSNDRLVLTSTMNHGASERRDIITDGQERITHEDADSQMLERVYWQEDQLEWEGRRQPKPGHQGDSSSWTSEWSLSEHGKVLTIARFVHGRYAQTLVFDKK